MRFGFRIQSFKMLLVNAKQSV